eukprot:GEMP01113301.1.p1 GENE.GEMP01113301.1~~GEMP01113301.1.p1  ORF type:complete len:156 (+),score=25.10 GEMP01113301.1:116-583(+)
MTEQILQMGMQMLSGSGGDVGAADGATRDVENPEGLQKGDEAQQAAESEHFKGTGKRRALMIGCNYIGSKAALKGCINDVVNLKKLLMETWGWSEDDITTMTDTDTGSRKPTNRAEPSMDWAGLGGPALWHHQGVRSIPVSLPHLKRILLPLQRR